MTRRLRPFVEREATWAVALAALGFVSMCATLPAATLLGVRAIRRRRGGDGSEPALGVLAFGFMWLSFLLAYPAMRAIVMAAVQPGEWGPRAFLGTLVVLAGIIVAMATLAVRIHPERWVARRFLFAGIGLAIAVAFTQAMVLVLGGLPAWSLPS
jgi:FtsH-binding integral membrane protein